MSQDLLLVTGSTGTVGMEVVKAALSAGLQVRATYTTPRSQAKLEQLGVTETVSIDLQDPVSLEAAFHGVTDAFLLVPFTPQLVELGQALIQAAQRSPVRFVVRLSAFGASPDASTLTGQWHGQLDHELHASGIPYAIVQPNFFMQNFMTFYGEMIRQQHVLALPYGDAAVSWVDVRDIAATVVACIQQRDRHHGQTYVLTGPQALTTHDIAALFSEVLGQSVVYHDIPEATAIDALKAQGTPDILVQALSELNGIARGGHSAMVSADVESVTGRPAIPFHQFIQDYKAGWMTA